MGKKSRLKPKEAELKILFAKSGNVCAFPGCNNPIIAEEGDETKPLAEMAHIIAYENNGPRSDPALPVKDRNKASNFILLCPTHHTLVDKFEYQYNVHVLREMKRIHEESSTTRIPENKEKPLKNEILHTSLLPISRLPRFVFSANTPYRKNNVLELFDVLNTQEHRKVIYAFELRDKKLYTFFDLNKSDNPFRGAYDKDSVHPLKATDLWLKPDMLRLYVHLLPIFCRRVDNVMGCVPQLREVILGVRTRPGLDTPAGASPPLLVLSLRHHLALESYQADEASAQEEQHRWLRDDLLSLSLPMAKSRNVHLGPLDLPPTKHHKKHAFWWAWWGWGYDVDVRYPSCI